MGRLKLTRPSLNNTNSFGPAGYVIDWVHRPNSTFGGIFTDEVVLEKAGLMSYRYVQLSNIKDAYNILDGKLSDSKNIEFEDAMRYIAETVQEYYRYDSKTGAINAMLSQNLLKYISDKLPGLDSYFKETGIEIQTEENKSKREVYAFNLVSFDGRYYIFDSTIPNGIKDNLQPIVAELPKHVFTALVESPCVGYAVELEYSSALTGKKMHYILDYRAKSKYNANKGNINEFDKRIIVSPEELRDVRRKPGSAEYTKGEDKKDGPSLDN